MDLLNILINPLNLKSTCFLCFKQYEETLSAYQKLFIRDEYQTTDTTLSGIMEYLFPTHDVLFGQACTNCTNFLLKAFTMLHKHNIMRDILCNITTSLSEEVECVKEIMHSTKLYVRLKLPIFDYIYKNCFTSNDCDESDYIGDVKTKTEFNVNDESIISCYEYCKKCQMKFVSKELLNQHVKMTHRNLNDSAICEFCGKDCKKPATLKVHLNCHKEKTCPYCSKTLKSHSHYKIHVKNHEVKVKRASRKSEYFCNICPFKSLNKNSLEAHVNKIHLRIRPFACEICHKGFYKKSNLTEHLTIHKKVKTLTCEQCGDSFVTKKTLIEHLRLHSGVRPFQCEICSLTFVTSGRRSDHFKRKHMEKTICCFICDKKFSLKKELNSHVKKFHGQNNSEGLALTEPNDSLMFSQNFFNKEQV